ncbi:Tetratricopeptide repeat-containing protein [Spirosomataceae bacterium TFI 002]|nr:Tetratricopeptide repeat-containing protein [Spirosomataceae bacterium TFI 002]
MKKAILLLFFCSLFARAQESPTKFVENLRVQEFNSIEELDSTFNVFEKLSIPEDSKLVAEANYIFGKRYFSKSVLDKSMDLLLKAKAQLVKHKMNRELADTFHFLGLNANKTGQKENAKKYFVECEKLAIAVNDTFNMINALHGLGRLNQIDSLYVEAEDKYERALQLGLSSRDSLSFSYSYDFLSQIMGITNRPEKALDYQLKAMRIREFLGDKYALAISINNVGEAYRLLNKDKEAELYFLKALDLCKTIGFRDLESYIYTILIDFAKKRKEYDLALTYAEKQKELSDSIFSDNMTKSLAEVQGKYELAEKERVLAEKEIAYQNQKMLSLLGLLALILVIGIAFYIFKRKQVQKRILEAQSIAKLEKERIRIARDLHDNLGPELAHVSSKLDMLSYQQKESETGKLANLANATRAAMDQLRDTIWSIRGEEITLSDFAAKVREFAQKRLNDYGIEFQEVCSNDEKILGPSQALNLYRVCQEAINNAAKYANSQKVSLEMSCGDSVNITIKDNGEGFDKETIKQGYGLRNMQERVSELGGQIAIDSNKNGTEIKISVPLRFILEG